MLDITCHLVCNSDYFNHFVHVCVDGGGGEGEREGQNHRAIKELWI